MWKTVKLGDVCTIIKGSTPLRREKKYWEEGNVPWFTIDDFRVQGKNITYTQQNVTQAAVDDKKVRLVPENSILLCCTASIGEVAIARKEMATNQQFNALTPNPSVINSDYLYFVATTLTQTLLNISGSTTINFISMGKLKEISIPLPTLTEQKRIVAKLDTAFTEIDKAIELAKSKEDAIKKLSTSLLSDSFIDNTVKQSSFKLKDVVTYEKVNAQGSSLPYLGMENISSDTMQIVDELEIPTSSSSTFKFNKTHVLYGRLRPYLKKVLVPNFEGQCSTEIFCLKPSSNLNRKFLAYWLLSPKITDKINNTCTGARMPRANMNALLEFDFFLPSLGEQERIVAKLDATIAEIEIVKIAMEKMQENYEALKLTILTQELQSEVA